MVELLISMVTAVVIMGAVLTASVRHSSERQANSELNLALVACTNTLEELRSLPVDVLPSIAGAGFDVPGSNGSPGGLQPLADDADGLPGQILINMDQFVAPNSIYFVRVLVVWDGVNGPQQLAVDTLMTGRK